MRHSCLSRSVILTWFCSIAWQPSVACAWDGETATDLSRTIIWSDLLTSDNNLGPDNLSKHNYPLDSGGQVSAGSSFDGHPPHLPLDQAWHGEVEFGFKQLELTDLSRLHTLHSVRQYPAWLNNLGPITFTILGPQVHLNPFPTATWAHQRLQVPSSPQLNIPTCRNISGSIICP